ncbi:MAG: LysM peptidoglycan-binding domain-containing protein [Actinobacteria bacterium]|nr:LysM peptidoglycan-binding domain-containing protein [Actinomycetota bacterium]
MASVMRTFWSWLDLVSVVILVGCLLYLAAWMAGAVRVRVRRTRRIRATALPRLLPLVGLAIAAGPRPEDSTRDPSGPPRGSPQVAAPWSEPDGWTPPRPSGSVPPSRTHAGQAPRVPSRHPAIHPERRSDDQVVTPLFVRAGRKVVPRPHRRSDYMIAAGDSLWRIAQRELGTDDPVAIHDYWQRIFQVNRSTLGPDPDLIFVGQRIKLPAHKT